MEQAVDAYVYCFFIAAFIPRAGYWSEVYGYRVMKISADSVGTQDRPGGYGRSVAVEGRKEKCNTKRGAVC